MNKNSYYQNIQFFLWYNYTKIINMKSRIRHSTTITYKFPIEAEILHENLRTSESTKVISLASLKFLS